MRLIFAPLALPAPLVLSACAKGSGPNNSDEFYPNCQEQSAMANQGRTDGRDIQITCPQTR